MANGRKRQNQGDGNNAQRHEDKGATRSAPKKQAPSANGEDDKHLGRNRFDKPSSLKQRLAGVEQVQ